MWGSPRLLILVTLAGALIVGTIAALAVNKWWIILLPLAAHGLGTFVVVSGVFKRLEQGDKPDPVTEAHSEDRDGQAV